MALALSDLSYDLLTLVRTYDRANDFARAEEYRCILDRVEEQDQEYSDLLHKYDDLNDLHNESIQEIADTARSALDHSPNTPAGSLVIDLALALQHILDIAEQS